MYVLYDKVTLYVIQEGSREMKYDFTSIIDRKGKDAIAVDFPPFAGAVAKEGFDTIPMWVADMNFATVPTVVQAMRERLDHPTFGYFAPRDE